MRVPGDPFWCHPKGARLQPELLAPSVLARAQRAVPPLGFARRARLAERQAILIEGVTRSGNATATLFVPPD
jgi:hypothetical protein